MMNRQRNHNEIISMEEYLYKRQQIREAEEQKNNRTKARQEKSPVQLMAELYV